MPGSDMACFGLLEGGGEELGAIGGPIVGHHSFNLGSEPGIPGQCPIEKAGSILAAEAWQQLDISDPGSIVDGDVQMLVTDMAGTMMAGIVTSNAMANPVDLA